MCSICSGQPPTDNGQPEPVYFVPDDTISVQLPLTDMRKNRPRPNNRNRQTSVDKTDRAESANGKSDINNSKPNKADKPNRTDKPKPAAKSTSGRKSRDNKSSGNTKSRPDVKPSAPPAAVVIANPVAGPGRPVDDRPAPQPVAQVTPTDEQAFSDLVGYFNRIQFDPKPK